MMKRFIFSIFLLPLLLASPQTKAQGIMLTPKWTAQAQFTGYYVADKLDSIRRRELTYAYNILPSQKALFRLWRKVVPR